MNRMGRTSGTPPKVDPSAHMYTHTHSFIHMHALTYTHALTHSSIHTPIHTLIHTHTGTLTHPCKDLCYKKSGGRRKLGVIPKELMGVRGNLRGEKNRGKGADG